LGNDPRVSDLEALLDRGFSSAIDLRFQTVEELIDRLKGVLAPAADVPSINPVEFAKRSRELLLKHDRKTQLAAYVKGAVAVVGALGKNAEGIRGGVSPYTLKTKQWDKALPTPDNTEPIENGQFVLQIGVAHNPHRVLVAYEVRARGAQAGVFRQVVKLVPPRFNSYVHVKEVADIMWYEGVGAPDTTAVTKDLLANITEAMQLIEREIIDARGS